MDWQNIDIKTAFRYFGDLRFVFYSTSRSIWPLQFVWKVSSGEVIRAQSFVYILDIND